MKCTFEDNVGTGLINAVNSNITIVQSTIRDNVRSNYGILTLINCNITIISSNFINNDGMLFSVSNFAHNLEGGSTIPLASTSTIIIGCEFRNSQQNTEHYSMIFIDSDVNNSDSDVLSIYDTKFINNKANKILYAVESVINIDNSTFKYTHGLAMDLCTCIVDIFNSVFNNNEAGALKLFNTIIHIHGSEFKENAKDGAIHSSSKSFISFSEVCTLVGNQAKQGGAIYLNQGAQCLIAYGATVIIANNTASSPAGVSHVGIFHNITVKWVVPYNGGGIYLDNHSKLTLHSQSTLQILENRATVDGGGIYLSDRSNVTLHSQSTLQILENRATENGGGIYVVKSSSINLGFKSLTNISQTSNSTVYFYGNRARIGGGLYLGLDSQVYAFRCLNNTVIFDENSANYGGAMYATAAKSSCNIITLIQSASFSLRPSEIQYKITIFVMTL